MGKVRRVFGNQMTRPSARNVGVVVCAIVLLALALPRHESVNPPRLSTMRTSGSAAGQLPAKALAVVPRDTHIHRGCVTVSGNGKNNGLYNYIIIRFAETTHPESVYIPLREAHDDTADRMASIYQKCPTASMEIILAAFKYGRQYQIEPELLLAIAYVESSFRPWVVNAGCYGLMQVSLATWKSKLQLNVGSLLEVDYNMDKGAAILRWWIDACHGDLWKAVHRYNCGYKYRNMTYVPKVRKFYRGIGGENEIYCKYLF
jgi:hypothetical protein